MFAMTDWPVRDWPRFALHHPPQWLWWLALRLPARWRWRIADLMSANMPGTCFASVAQLGIGYPPFDGLSASRCRPDNGACWCGKYRDVNAWAEDMQGAIADPLDGISIQFCDEGATDDQA